MTPLVRAAAFPKKPSESSSSVTTIAFSMVNMKAAIARPIVKFVKLVVSKRPSLMLMIKLSAPRKYASRHVEMTWLAWIVCIFIKACKLARSTIQAPWPVITQMEPRSHSGFYLIFSCSELIKRTVSI